MHVQIFAFFVVSTKNIEPKGIPEDAEHAAGEAQSSTQIPECKSAVIMMCAIQSFAMAKGAIGIFNGGCEAAHTHFGATFL